MITINPDIAKRISPTTLPIELTIATVNVLVSGESIIDIQDRDMLVRNHIEAVNRVDAVIDYLGHTPNSLSVNGTPTSLGYFQANFARQLSRVEAKSGTRREGVEVYLGITSGSSTELLSYLLNTLGEAWTGSFDSLNFENKTTSRFSTIDHTGGVYTQNTQFLYSGFDWSGIAIWNSYSNSNQRGVTAISPRHVLMANHFPVPNGTTVRFMGNNGVIVNRTVISSSQPIVNQDIRIGVLNSDLPSSVIFYPILPNNYKSEKIYHYHKLPVICWNRLSNALVHDSFDAGFSGVRYIVSTGSRQPWSSSIVVGDSGQPVFCLLNNQPILLTAHYAATYGPELSDFQTEINNAMTTLGGGYQLTILDLSAYTSFNE
jgi:hypothetical protein